MHKKVLLDLWHAISMGGGLAQDNRLNFKLLADIPTIEVSGLLHTQAEKIKLKQYENQASAFDKNMMQTNLYFHALFNRHQRPMSSRLQKFFATLAIHFSQELALSPIDKKIS